MRHRKRVKKLSRTKAHRERLLENLAVSAFTHYGIVTTLVKAKEASKFISRLITFAKSGTPSARRRVFAELHDKRIVDKLFNDVAPRFAERKSGYTRIVRLGPRKGDGAQLALLELLGFETECKAKQDRLLERRKEREERRLRGEV